MSNTLKLGNGQWATGKDTVLSFSDTNNNYKPLPFSFSRDTSATVVNKDGLIETVGSGEPRIDFKDNTKGALLLEPQRSNLIQYSEAFNETYWNKSNTNVVSSQLSPKGDTSAFKLLNSAVTSTHYLNRSSISVASGVDYTFSILAKKGGNDFITVMLQGTGWLGSSKQVSFNLANGTFDYADTGLTYKSTLLSSGFYRIEVTNETASTSVNLRVYTSATVNNTSSYLGDGTSGVYIFGAQLEQGSYPTSYIPTSGQSGGVTRVAEQNNLSSINHLIGATQGSWFLDWGISNSDTRDNTEIGFELSSDNSQDELNFSIGSDGNMRMFVRANNAYNQKYTTINKSGKWCLIWNGTSLKLFQDGLQVYSDENALVYNNYTTYNMSPNIQYKLNNTQIFNLALTDAEAIALTTI